ncbi:MAG: hypothetical protein LBD24_07945 [Spirochaetaceae bacterium]|jgi:hypothetical protein|nr:hypothetical protein [Spirochaetaceae bacterium]
MKHGIMGVAAAAVLFSCNLEIPQDITVKGSPEARIPLGYISSVAGEGNGVKDKLGSEHIKGKIETSGLRAYQYDKDSSDTLIYLVHKPIANMNLNLSEYVRALDVEWTDNPGQPVPGTGTYADIPLPLDEMKQWVTSVTDAEFILTLKNITGSGTISVKFNNGPEESLPISGQPLTFRSGVIPSFDPAVGMTVSINAPAGSSYVPELDFEWVSAVIKADGDDFTGSASMDLRELTDFLGADITFSSVRGYIFISELPAGRTAYMTLEEGGGAPPLLNNETVTVKTFPASVLSGPVIPADLGLDANPSVPPVDLTDTFKSSNGDIRLAFTIAMTGTSTITKVVSDNGTIKADMFIELPLEFDVTYNSAAPATVRLPNNPAYRNSHLRLDFPGVTPSLSEDDLFGRKGNEDDLLNSIETITIQARNIRNTVIGSKDENDDAADVSLGIWNRGAAGAATGESIAIRDGSPLAEAALAADYPFVPEFEILVPCQTVGSDKTGILTILRPRGGSASDFDFFLAVTAKATIEKTVDL